MDTLDVEIVWLALGHDAVPEQHAGSSGLAVESTAMGTEDVWVAKGGSSRSVHSSKGR